MSVSRLQGVKNVRRRVGLHALLCLLGAFFLFTLGATASRAQDDGGEPAPPPPMGHVHWSVFDSINDAGGGVAQCIAAGTVYDDQVWLSEPYKVQAEVIVYYLWDTGHQYGQIIYVNKGIDIPHQNPGQANMSYHLDINLALCGVQPGTYSVEWRGDAVAQHIATPNGVANTNGWDIFANVTVPSQ